MPLPTDSIMPVMRAVLPMLVMLMVREVLVEMSKEV
jgi:hypothetical protein